ncbi:phenazine biosynthesis protein PhzF family protein [Ceratobasidium sp. AG-Ba]|nr:phenazine biosynthesis protein PhzF family protein [Ceratobasidium sp. AG-Ba]QRW06308.1 phenazine biosynthesis protein PhzF family protein [Ceratobasidium sp. AG-Ba]
MVPRARQFMQIDVFNSASTPLSGNPVAVVLSSDDLSTEQMQKFAVWTNLSETTFILPPTNPDKADYRLRIFSTYREMKFAGHPTLGSCRAWLENGGQPKNRGEIIQECGIGLVTIKKDPSSGRLSFAATAFLRDNEMTKNELKTVCDAMGVETDQVLTCRWVDNGPGWAGILLKSAQDVLAMKKDHIRTSTIYNWGVVGAYEKAQEQVQSGLKGLGHTVSLDANVDDSPHFEVRAFATRIPSLEDPVTGSLK